MHHTTEAQKANPFLNKPNKKTKKEYREWCVLEFEIDMQQDKGGSSEEIMKQNQDRRLKPMEGENQNQQQHHQPQKCPRCESLNTKFCYYNNYSLSQPRYFCKTCRRYWTQGGTLRNVPVGGGCRKGKKAKSSTNASSSSENSSRSQSQNTNSGNTTASPVLISKDQSGNLVSPHHPGISSLGPPPYYSGGGFLGSLAAIQSLNNQPPSQSFSLNLPVNLGGGDLGGPSNLSLLHGFDTIPSFGSQQQQQQQQQQQIQQQRQFYQMGNRDTKSSGDHSHFYSSSSNSQHQNWHHQAFINNTNPTTTVSDTALWSISTSTTTANTNSSRNNNNTGGSFPLNPADHHHHHQWHDLPGYGPPP